MISRSLIELVLGLGAILLLARDANRAWVDRLRRPSTLLMAAVVTVVLAGTMGGLQHPEPWWLVVPGLILAWEARRGWRQAPRCRLWESGVGAFALGVLLAGAGLQVGAGTVGSALLAAAAGASLVGAVLLWQSHRREPRAWRANDVSHYERRSKPRPA